MSSTSSYTSKKSKTVKVLSKYVKLSKCAQDYLDVVDVNLSSKVVKKILSRSYLISITGRVICCINKWIDFVLVTYDKTFFAPTDTNMVLVENRDFESACILSILNETHENSKNNMCK